jgi:hypothetical protein
MIRCVVPVDNNRHVRFIGPPWFVSPYVLTQTQDGILTITFSTINLPDSSKGSASQVYITHSTLANYNATWTDDTNRSQASVCFDSNPRAGRYR